MPVHRPNHFVESLEARRLLTFQFFGTAGDDTILVQYNHAQQEYRFTLNGSPAGATEDTDILIFALEGNDSITIPFVQDESDITVRGGSGDDRINVGSGNLATDLQGRLVIEELGGSGLADELFADDSLDNFVPDHSVSFRASNHPDATHALYSGASPTGGSVHFDQNLNIISVLSSSSADTIYVEAAPRGMSLSLGAGDDQVIYGDRSSHVLEDVLPTGSINGGTGLDRVVFDDAGGPAQGRAYTFSGAQFGIGTAMNQQLTGIHTLVVNTRNTGGVGGGSTPNSVLFEGGFPITDDVLINGGGLGDRTFIGTPTAPIDLDSGRVKVVTTNPGHKEIHDQERGGLDAHFVLTTGGAPLRQIVATDAFQAEFIPVSSDVNRNIDLHGGSTRDVIQINSTLAGRNIGIFGGGGNDEIFNFTPDLDAAFSSPAFIAGGAGDDSLVLDDSQDQTDDDDDEYRLLPSITVGWIFDKAGNAGPTGPVINYTDDLERVTLTADNGPSTIRFQGLPTQHLTLNGGGGNDFITNARFGQPGSLVQHSPASTVITGGAGNDTISINDQADGLVSEYALTPSQFSFRSGLNAPRTLAYDGSTENFFLDQNNVGTTTRFDGKPPAMRATISTFGGDDVLIVGGGDIDGSGISSATSTLLGGTGNDRIEFDDRLDDHGASDADTFTFEFQRVTKDGVAIIYAGFESQKLYTSGVNNSPTFFPNTVRMHGIDMPTEVVGTAGNRDNTVAMGHPTFGVSQVTFGPITLDFTAAPAIVNVNDQVATTARNYALTSTQLLLPSVVSYSGVAALNIYAGRGNDMLNVNALSAQTNLYFSGNDGNDLMSVGDGGPLAPVAGRVNLNGDAGTDELFITNGLGGGFTDAILTSNSFTANGGPQHLYSTAERIYLIVNDAGSDVELRSLSAPTTVHGDGGDDDVRITDLVANITFDGGGEVNGDSVMIDDTAFTTHVGYIIEGNSIIRSEGSLAANGVEHTRLETGSGHNNIDVRSTLPDLRLLTNAGNDTINVYDSNGFVTVNTGSEEPSQLSPVGDSIAINNDSSIPGDVPGAVRIDQDDTIFHLMVHTAGTLRIEDDAVLCKTTSQFNLPIFLRGVIDLAGGTLLHRADGLNNPFRQWLTSGCNAGAWNGTSATGAINSSLAASTPIGDGVGYGFGSQVAPTSIGSFAINPGDILIRYALDGDANLDGTVNLQDFNRLASRFGQSNRVWSDGDFDYTGNVNLVDFNLLASNFGRSDGPSIGGTSDDDGDELPRDPLPALA
jgi:hypothetical protein